MLSQTATTATPRIEMLQVADAVSREKQIDREIVLEAMEQAIEKAGKAKYGPEHDIRAGINRKSGEITLQRYREVVEVIEDELTQINLRDANTYQPGLEIGQFLIEPLPPIDLGRIAAQSAKQVIVQKVREAERLRQYEEFKDRKGEIITGIVKRVEYGNVTVDLGRGEGVIRRDEVIPRELFRNGDRVRCYIYDVRDPETEHRGPIVFLSRTHPMFLAMLFAQEVPEIYDGIIEIKSVARDPGSRAKISVISNDSAVDPVGACVGLRGSRVQAVVAELQGEKIDIIPFVEDVPQYVTTALQPATVSKIIVDDEAGRLDVVVGEDQLSLAIGRRGQNVRLASQLTGWQLDIMTEDEESEKRTREFAERSAVFKDALEVEDLIAQLLVSEGFTTIEQVAYLPVEDIAGIEGFDAEVAQQLQDRAKEYLEQQTAAIEARLVELGVEQDLIDLDIFDIPIVLQMAEQGVKTRDDLADLAGDELQEILSEYAIDLEDANKIIMRAREHWYEDDPSFNASDEDGAGEEGADSGEEQMAPEQ